ncbi:MAG: restriction endonuclease subunit S [Desulfobacterales bacterium]|nr:restriction endonuclease subunit S [Desulfobacterales bacterium]
MRDEWKTAKLGEIASIGAGNSAPQKKESFQNGIYPFVRTSDVGKIRFGSIYDSTDKLNDKGATKLRLISKGSILVPKSGASTFLNHRVILGCDSYVSSHLATIKANPEYALDYYLLYYLLTVSSQNLIQDHKYPSLKLSDISNICVLLPPLNEQKRIVAILDEAFAGIEKAVVNTEKNLANARELFENYLNSVFRSHDYGWTELTLGEIAEFKNGLNFTKNSKGEHVKIVGVKNFQSNYWVPMHKLEIAQIDGKLSESYKLQKGDILTVRSNGNKNLIGRCMLAGDIPEPTSHSGFTIRIRLISSIVEPTFLVHYLKTDMVRDMLIKSGGGVNISSLNQTVLSRLPIQVPEKNKQRDIVNKIETLQQETLTLDKIYTQKLTALTELKQSLLQKAFSGELTANPNNKRKEAAA